jgi:hypothetical protein
MQQRIGQEDAYQADKKTVKKENCSAWPAFEPEIETETFRIQSGIQALVYNCCYIHRVATSFTLGSEQDLEIKNKLRGF